MGGYVWEAQKARPPWRLLPGPSKRDCGPSLLLQAYKGLSLGRWWNLFSMTFKKMASELDADKLAVVADECSWCSWCLGLCLRSAGSRAQLSSVQSCQWPVEQWKERLGNAVYWVASVCQHSARSFECFDPLLGISVQLICEGTGLRKMEKEAEVPLLGSGGSGGSNF